MKNFTKKSMLASALCFIASATPLYSHADTLSGDPVTQLFGAISNLGKSLTHTNTPKASSTDQNGASTTPTSGNLTGNQSITLTSFGDGNGYQPTVTVQIPPQTCNQQVFLDGYKDKYVYYWNQWIYTKTAEFSLANDKAGKKNLAYYKDLEIGARKYMGHPTNYNTTDGSAAGWNANQCLLDSRTSGETAAMEAVQAAERIAIQKEL